MSGKCIHNNADVSCTTDDREYDPQQLHKRVLTGTDRKCIAAAVQKNVKTSATIYYDNLSEMNSNELLAGNITKCQTPDIIRKAAMELKYVHGAYLYSIFVFLYHSHAIPCFHGIQCEKQFSGGPCFSGLQDSNKLELTERPINLL